MSLACWEPCFLGLFVAPVAANLPHLFSEENISCYKVAVTKQLRVRLPCGAVGRETKVKNLGAYRVRWKCVLVGKFMYDKAKGGHHSISRGGG